MFSLASKGPGILFLILGIFLGLAGIWMSIPALLGPRSSILAFDRNRAEAAAAYRMPAMLAANVGVIRGDLWATAAFTGARVLWAEHPQSPSESESKLLAHVKSEAETALALAPINGAVWLFLASLPAPSPEAENRVATLLEMSYFTAPSAPLLAPWRLQRVATSHALTDRDIQAFVKNDLRGMLNRRPEFQQAILAAYRNAWPQNQPILEALVAGLDPETAQLLRSSHSQ